MLQLLSLSLLLLPALSLCPVVEQERQRTAKRKDDERLKDVGVYIVTVVAVAAIDMILVVVGLVVIPASEFGVEEGADPF